MTPKKITATLAGKVYELELRRPTMRQGMVGCPTLDDLPAIVRRLMTTNDYLASDVRRVIMAAVWVCYGQQEAERVIDEHVDKLPVHDSWALALNLATARQFGETADEETAA